MPGFVLKLKGKLDAATGRCVAEKYVAVIQGKLSTLEAREALLAQRRLLKLRTNGAVAISSISANQKTLDAVPQPRAENSKSDIQANRDNEQRRARAITAIRDNYRTIVEINEQMTDVDSCLEQRLFKTRQLAVKKLSEYVSGVRSTFPDFDYGLKVTDVAKRMYSESHMHTDAAIRMAAERIMERGSV